MGTGAGWEIMGRRRKAGGSLGLERCCGRGGSVYIMGYEVGDGGRGDVVDVGEGGEEENVCRLFGGWI